MKILIVFILQLMGVAALSQSGGLRFQSTDTSLEHAFDWAKKMALSYRGDPAAPAGPWYEAALPSRNAFCIRDVSHQCLPAELLSMTAENKNILKHFLTNISESKDWCTYWEINKNGEPAPEDYRNDSAFWYNLNANMDLIYSCWRLYLWTADKSYINNPALLRFMELSTNQYIQQWTLQADALLARPGYPNRPADFNLQDNFHRCRGLPSYVENVPDLSMGIDLVAALYRGFATSSAIARQLGKNSTADRLLRQANAYRQVIDRHWWDPVAQHYNTYYTQSGTFGKGEGETFLFWFDALQDSLKTRKTLDHLLAGQWNVENLSYLPVIFYDYGYTNKAEAMLRYLSNPATPRREYPEVSYGIIDGLVRGHMGINADARYNRLQTAYHGAAASESVISGLRVLGTVIELRQSSSRYTLRNRGKRAITWRAVLQGYHPRIMVGGMPRKSHQQTEKPGNTGSYIDLKVSPGQQITVELK